MIETPPEGRRPIRTYVGEYDEELVKAGARARARARRPGVLPAQPRRDDRGGGGEAAAARARACAFLVAHGQMRGARARGEDARRSSRGDADVLVSTTIIESGLDIPQANTLIVERADRSGSPSSTRSAGASAARDVLAHAYLFYPDARELTPEARARLATLADHTELGAGFAIAMRDLEIRGAGDLLGAEQSGHVAALGFELYVEMLHEAVAELSGQRRLAARPVRVDARVDAYVPGGLHRGRGAEDRPAPPARADRDRGRAARAAGRDRGPLRPAARAGREPVRDPGGEAEARAARRRLPRLPRRQGDGRAARARLRRAARAARRARHRGLHDARKREVTLRADEFTGALELVDAMLDARQAA